MQYMLLAENLILTLGVALTLYALIRYVMRTKDYQGFWRIFINRLKDGFIIAEFKYYRAGILLLILGVLLRFVNLLLFPH